jgi:hypothetical protein
MIKIKINTDEVTRAMERLSKAVTDPSPVMPKLAGILHDAVMENFEQDGRPEWDGLHPATYPTTWPTPGKTNLATNHKNPPRRSCTYCNAFSRRVRQLPVSSQYFPHLSHLPPQFISHSVTEPGFVARPTPIRPSNPIK